MAVFRLLADPTNYVACDWDLSADRPAREHWVRHFLDHYDVLHRLIQTEYAPSERELADFRDEYRAEISMLGEHPERFHRPTILTLDCVRDRLLRRHGFDDPFRGVKARENAAALELYPGLIAELDAMDPDDRLTALLEGVFAGNIFDLGPVATHKLYHENGIDFFGTRARLARRPWLVDGFDAIRARWAARSWRYARVMLFADNAGCDFVLGCLPLVREFAVRRGAQVTIAANTGPSLNDILAPEVADVLSRAARVDPLLAPPVADGRVHVFANGNLTPLIDLTDVNEQTNAQAVGVDLLILQGQGRGVESNFDARFTVDTAKFALLKDTTIAARLGGKLFDVCCKFEPLQQAAGTEKSIAERR